MCGKLHEKRFNIYETIPIPAHPRCRCTIIPVVEPTNQLMVVEENLTTLNKDDIMIGRSIGAAAKNYPIKAPDSK